MAQERKPKRQRFSLGGPSVDTSFEDYLTGNTRNGSSEEEEEEEEEFDQENQDPLDEPEEGDYEDEDEEETHAPPMQSTKATTTSTSSSTNLVNMIHTSQNLTPPTKANTTSYLLQTRLILPNADVPVTRLLHVPSNLLFEQLSTAIITSFDWSGTHLWKFTLETSNPNPTFSQSITLPNPRREIANIRDLKGLHELGPPTHKKDLDSKRLRLLDLWGIHQTSELRGLKVFYTYDCYGDAWYHCVTFLGVAEDGLEAPGMGVEVSKGQQVWCFGGSGAAWPEDATDESLERWEEECNKYEWDLEGVNGQLAGVEVRTAESYRRRTR